MTRPAVPLSLLVVALLLAGCIVTEPPAPGPAPGSDAAGTYYCETDGTEACASESPLVLQPNGNWGFAGYAGTYAVAAGKVAFQGVGGPAAWGDGTLGDGSIRFETTVWVEPAASVAHLAGSYRCADCVGATPIVLAAGGTWTWGASGGSFVLFPDAKLRFFGPSSGPPGWGLATLGDNAFTFRETTYVREA